MHIPSRGEVLSWNENQVADLLREHKLLDCVDCIYQRQIDGQKLLNLKEDDVMFFLEIHDKRSRGKFWNVVKQITEKKGGVQKLMNKFQDNMAWNAPTVEEEQYTDSDDDSFESDYDEPDEEQQPSQISLERQETIKNNLLANLIKRGAPQKGYNHGDYPESEDYPEDIYDVPEEGCGEPEEDTYDVPSDESGGGVVTRHPALGRQASEQYLIPDDRQLLELAQTPDEEDYEDLGGAHPPGRAEDFDTQEDYVVPDLKPATSAPPRPPKATGNGKPLPPPVGNVQKQPKATGKGKPLPPPVGNVQKQPKATGNGKPLPPPVTNVQKHPQKVTSGIKNLQSMFEQKQAKAPPQPPRISNKVENKPPETQIEPEQEDYEFPDYHPPAPGKKPALKPPPVSPAKKPLVSSPATPKKPSSYKKVPDEPEQETYEPPDQPSRHDKPPINKNVPAIPDQETYEPPDQPPRLTKKSPFTRPPAEIEQEDYEAPEAPARPTTKPPHLPIPEQEDYVPPDFQRNDKPVMDPEENYEAPDQLPGMGEEEPEQEDYDIPDKPEMPVKEAPEETATKKSPFKSLFNRPSKKGAPNVPRTDKKKSPAMPSPAVPDRKQAPSRQPPFPAGKNVSNITQPENRLSMALPSLPTDGVDSKGPNASPSLPPKPIGSKEKPVQTQRSKPDLPTSRFPSKSKAQLLQDQSWFHGTISKSQVSDLLKSAKKDGAYLVRNSSRDPGQFTMSILYKNDIRHLNIPCDSKGHYRLGDSGVERFKNIEELVTYFNKHDVEFSAGGKTPLTHACLKS